MTTTSFCKSKCCEITIGKYTTNSKNFNKNYRKSGVFIYDPSLKKVLLVQSRGNLWGPPKGSLNFGETFVECAIREVKEETGLTVSSKNFIKKIKIKKSIFFYLEMDLCNVDVQNYIYNDANGITWINIECLKECISKGSIVLNFYGKYLFNKFLNLNFTPKI